MYSIKEVSEKTGFTIQTLYRQIKNQKSIGRFFKKNILDEWEIDEGIINTLPPRKSRAPK